MRVTMTAVIPGSATNFINRYWVNIGVSTLALGIFTSRTARKILSLPLFNFLGRVSFAVYLLHDTLIRTLMVWMIYGVNAGKTDLSVLNDKGQPINRVPAASGIVFLFAVPVFYITLYALAHLWTRYVDAWCGTAMNRIRVLMFRPADNSSVSAAPAAAITANGVVEEKELELREPLMAGEGPVLPLTNPQASS